MANPEHLNWLREGVGPWNDRRRNDPFDPDLGSEDVSRALGGHEREDIRQISVQLRGINLSGADLRNSTLRDTDLTGAALLGSKLSGANLIGSDLSGTTGADTKFGNAILHSTKLPESQYFYADFSGAQLVGADMGAATFFGCNFDGAHLYSADMVGAKFMLSRPWRARLFFPSSDASIATVPFKRNEVGAVTDILDGCRVLSERYGEEVTLYFRGEGRFSWKLRPSVMRNSEDAGFIFRSAEAEMLNDLMTRQPDAFSRVDSALAQWVFAQHHGLKTRLLDITRNPLVALFNACVDNDPEDGKLHAFAVPRSLIKPFNSDTVRIIANFAKLSRGEQNLLLGKTATDASDDVFPAEAENFLNCRGLFSRAMARLYSIIRQESPYFEEKIDLRDLFRIVVVEPQRMFDRLRAQSGAFLISAFHERFEREEALKLNAEMPLYAHHVMKIPLGQKVSILNELRLLNVTGEVLFPSVDEAARAITEQREGKAHPPETE